MSDALTSKERMAVAMRRGIPDRVPLMCQLSLGHYFLQSGLDPVDIWHDTPTFGEALVRMQRRYEFDGILVNLPGRDPDWRRAIKRRETKGSEEIITWSNGFTTVTPHDDNAHVYGLDGQAVHPTFGEVEPEGLYYIEPHDLSGITYPYSFGFDSEPAQPGPGFFPPWTHDTVRWVAEHAPDVSVHAEVFSPFSQFLELVNYQDGLMALVTDPGKVLACLDRLTVGAIELGRGHVAAGADAVLISSAFAGAPFVSRSHYEKFVLPYERRLIAGIKGLSDIPVYIHSCGGIGDRLDLMEATGTDGIDTLDPPPLGSVDLAAAKEATRGRLFLKGNLDPVSDLLYATPEHALNAASERIEVGSPDGGYILSTACSVAPPTAPGNVEQLRRATERAWRSS